MVPRNLDMFQESLSRNIDIILGSNFLLAEALRCKDTNDLQILQAFIHRIEFFVFSKCK